MKRVILVLMFLSFMSGAFASSEEILSLSILGMGKAGLADVSSNSNPANIASRSEDDPSLRTYFSIQEDLEIDELSSSLGFFQYPTMRLGAQVYGSNLSLTLNNDSYLEDREYTSDGLEYTGYNKFILQLDWGYKINNFDFGMRLKGGSVTRRSNFELRSNFFFLTDYIVNTFFSNYTSLSNSDFFSLGFALRFNANDNLSLAIMSDSDLDLSSSDDTIYSYLQGISLGATYTSNLYTSTNQLNPFVYKFSIDILDIGDEDNRELRFGNEIRMQLSNNNSIAFRAGYYEDKETIADLFTFSDKGVTTYAIAYDSNDYAASLLLYVPIDSYSDFNDFTIGLSFEFRF
ncbi:MAG: hypothetical protein PQJ49_11420 [Sphaerochaetaceae bacterium]|nr:hypothetical protein [Sphaerochaetaceae bacterium]